MILYIVTLPAVSVVYVCVCELHVPLYFHFTEIFKIDTDISTTSTANHINGHGEKRKELEVIL